MRILGIKRALAVLLLSFSAIQSAYAQSAPEVWSVEYEGKEVQLTTQADPTFMGKYQGKKKGFLILNPDGTGEFKYDYSIGNACPNNTFKIKWGFLKGENGKPVKFRRSYGHSYPIFYKAIEGNRFKGCQDQVLLDWILVKKDGIHISSSDDWKKLSDASKL